MRRGLVLGSSALSALLAASGWAAAATVELLGERVVERQMAGSELPVGGLSGLAYDDESATFFAISDDPSHHGPARIYELAVDLGPGGLGDGAVRAVGLTTLTRADGSAFPRRAIDGEGLAAAPDGHWIVASEGYVENGVPPALFEFGTSGSWSGALRLPRWLRLHRRRGPRHNLALESAGVSPDGRWLFTATESALLQDGPEADGENGSLCRILRYHLPERRFDAAWAYRIEPIAAPPAGDEFAVNGLVEVLVLDGERLLTLERSFTAGRGNVIRVFDADLRAATRVDRRTRLARGSPPVPVRKRLLVDLATLGVRPDNLEGMAFGPDLADGRRTLVLVADDNFAPHRQRNQLIVLALEWPYGGAP